MNPQQRMAAVAAAKADILAHPMCYDFQDTPAHYLVLYPQGFRVDGCRVSKGMGQAEALKTLVSKMELHWGGGL